MAQQQIIDTGIRVPLAAAVWVAPTTIYVFDRSGGYGTFAATKNAAIYAPERGALLIQKDGTWILKKDIIQLGKALGVREWVGVSQMIPADGIKNNQIVEAGQLIGFSKEDFAFVLHQSIDNVSTVIDPVPFIISAPAQFVPADPRKAQERAIAGTSQPHLPTTAQPHADAPRSELATTAPAELAAGKEPPPRTFKPGHMVAAVAGGLALGGLVAYNMRRR